MNQSALVQVVGSLVACSGGTSDAWREAAALVAGQLTSRFGPTVRVEYYDLFDPHCPPLLPDSQLPLVLVNGGLLSSGGKLSAPAIARHLESLGLQATEHWTLEAT